MFDRDTQPRADDKARNGRHGLALVAVLATMSIVLTMLAAIGALVMSQQQFRREMVVRAQVQELWSVGVRRAEQQLTRDAAYQGEELRFPLGASTTSEFDRSHEPELHALISIKTDEKDATTIADGAVQLEILAKYFDQDKCIAQLRRTIILPTAK
jgi:hypothetical protein